MSKTLAFFALVAAVATAVPLDRVMMVAPHETNLRFPELFDRYFHVFAGNGPSGTYEGTKSVLGEDIDAKIIIKPDNTLEFTISGAVSIDCKNETYKYDAPNIDFPNITTAGDCLHDTLADNNVKLESVTYDPSSDTINVKVKYTVLTIALALTKVSGPKPVAARQTVLPMDELISRYYDVFMAHNPAGTYVGSKSVLGQKITTTAVITSDTTFDFSVAGPASFKCTNEPYTYSNGKLVLPNLNKDGDCLHDEMKANSITMEKFDYDAAGDDIQLEVKYTVLDVSIDMVHQG